MSVYKNSKFFLFNVILFFSLQDRAGQDVQMDEPPIMRLWNTLLRHGPMRLLKWHRDCSKAPTVYVCVCGLPRLEVPLCVVLYPREGGRWMQGYNFSHWSDN